MAGTVVSLVCLAGTLIASPRLLVVYKTLVAQGGRRSGLPVKALLFPHPQSAAAFFAVAAALFFACAALVCIVYFFENTESPEIHYFELFAFSFIFEVLCIVLPLQTVCLFSPFYVMASARLLVFVRFAALAALLAAGLFASGVKTRKQEDFLFPFGLAALIIALRIPVDIYSFNSNVSPDFGFPRMFAVLELCIVLAAAASFFTGAYGRGSMEYYGAGAGVLLLAAGKAVLRCADAAVLVVCALFLLFAGLALFCTNLRKLYMWL
jgi:hypothetical protein